MKGILWSLGYMIAGAVHAGLMHDEEGTAGGLFVDLFLWPVPVGALLMACIGGMLAFIADAIFALLEGEGQR